eukprot:NODE_3706_length_338_cov_114.072664_g3035_i0.p1 GENE.NODE_3706_length_338_cov_114.072664_g3035_i0~~NODE_3706_length_338_cov_114.072664_g3035_i0.p1  ORF type:complete len:69 (-),score=3.23 NODE_3706_length_338_cov_114.072664_g3035_i0:18-224(-)
MGIDGKENNLRHTYQHSRLLAAWSKGGTSYYLGSDPNLGLGYLRNKNGVGGLDGGGLLLLCGCPCTLR